MTSLIKLLLILFCINIYGANTYLEDRSTLKKYYENELSKVHQSPVRCPFDLDSCIEALSRIHGELDYLKAEGPTTLSYKKMIPFNEADYQNILFMKDLNKFIIGMENKPAPNLIPLKEAKKHTLHLSENESAFYQNLYDGNTLTISMFNGYFDHGNDIFNYHVELMSKETIKFFLESNGFSIIEGFPTFIHAEAKYSKTLKIQIKIYQSFKKCQNEDQLIDSLSSVLWSTEKTTFLSFNSHPYTFTREYCHKQEQHSAKIKKLFLKDINKSDILIYNGHSRNGRGPDFGKRFSKSGSVKKDKLTDMAINSPSLKAIYFNGCSGKDNYPRLIKEFPNQNRLIAWNDRAPEFLDTFYNLTSFLQSLIEQRPTHQIESRSNLLRRTDKWSSRVIIRGLK